MPKHPTLRQVKDTVTLGAFAITLAMAVKGWHDLGKDIKDVVLDKIDPTSK